MKSSEFESCVYGVLRCEVAVHCIQHLVSGHCLFRTEPATAGCGENGLFKHMALLLFRVSARFKHPTNNMDMSQVQNVAFILPAYPALGPSGLTMRTRPPIDHILFFASQSWQRQRDHSTIWNYPRVRGVNGAVAQTQTWSHCRVAQSHTEALYQQSAAFDLP